MTDSSILLIDKSAGMTSFDVIRRLRGILSERKLGHAGTLDPLATGLMIIGVGRGGTKQLNSFVKLDKTYAVAVRIGTRTDTADLEGTVLERKPVGSISNASIEAALEELTGAVELPVPRYSAVKIAGEPLHKRVRRGEQVTPPHRTMHVHSLALQRVYRDEDTLIADVVMDVASGVYVRSIAEAIGEHLGYPACVSELRRTRIGSYRVGDAYTLEQVAQHTQRTNE